MAIPLPLLSQNHSPLNLVGTSNAQNQIHEGSSIHVAFSISLEAAIFDRVLFLAIEPYRPTLHTNPVIAAWEMLQYQSSLELLDYLFVDYLLGHAIVRSLQVQQTQLERRI